MKEESAVKRKVPNIPWAILSQMYRVYKPYIWRKFQKIWKYKIWISKENCRKNAGGSLSIWVNNKKKKNLKNFLFFKEEGKIWLSFSLTTAEFRLQYPYLSGILPPSACFSSLTQVSCKDPFGSHEQGWHGSGLSGNTYGKRDITNQDHTFNEWKHLLFKQKLGESCILCRKQAKKDVCLTQLMHSWLKRSILDFHQKHRSLDTIRISTKPKQVYNY